VIAVLLLVGFLGCVEDPPPPAAHCETAESHVVPTDDGAVVHLHRHPAQSPSAQAPPVLIVHGISSNHNCWDLTEERSLATFLSRAGLDAWLLDLRGHGDSQRDVHGKAQRSGWSIDDYALHDIPAAIGRIKQVTGFDTVSYVGHSLGGMVGGIFAAQGGDSQLSSFVAVGTPMDFRDPDPLMEVGLKAGSAVGTVWPVLPSQIGARLQARLPNSLLPIDAMLFTDLTGEARKQMYQRVVSHLSAGELKQLTAVGELGSLHDAAGKKDHLASFSKIQTPALVIAGRGDLIAPVDRVHPTFAALGSPRKTFVVAGKATGFSADYGHLDLTLGDHVAQEIFPLILEHVKP
jgi:pimeloyl-ACP methyl ester carboxylesterase